MRSTSIISRAKYGLLLAALAFAPFAKAETDALAWNFKFDTILAFESQEPVDGSVYNPGNQVYKLPRTTGLLDIRPNAKVTLYNNYDLVLRPRLHIFAQDQKSGTDAFINEGYLLLRPLDSVQVAVGRENFQWGPAESLSPTNIFVERLLVDIEPFYEVLGTYEARANINIGGNLSWVSIGELNPVRDNSYAIDRPLELSEHRFGTKLEYNWDHSAKILGLFAGGRNLGEVFPAYGGYGSYVVSDAIQLYFDAVWQQLPDIIYPISGQDIVAGNQDRYSALAVVGTRYTLEDGTELRAEYIENQAGLDSEQQRDLKDGLASLPTRDEFLAVATSSPIPLPGQHYVYLSLRSSSQNVVWHFLRQPILQLHSLISTTDGSTLTFGSFESGFSNALTGYIFGGIAGGSKDSELRHLSDYLAGVGLRLSY